MLNICARILFYPLPCLSHPHLDHFSSK
jgi:hypothetical protein